MHYYNVNVKLSNNNCNFWTSHYSHHKQQEEKEKEDFDQC